MLQCHSNSAVSLFSLHGLASVLQYSSSATPRISSFTVDYLVNSLGFSRGEAISTSTKVNHLRSLRKPDSVINFFKQRGFDKIQIKTIVNSAPQILVTDIGRTLEPKIGLFEELGLSGSVLVKVISKNPSILRRGLSTHIIPTLEFLKSVLGTDDNVVKAIRRSVFILMNNIRSSLQPHIELLKKSGLSDVEIHMFVFQNPRAILCSPAMLEAVMISVEQKLGIPRQSAMFRYVVHALASVGEKYFEAKFDIFRSFGWSESDIISLARNDPFCFALSEVNIRNKLVFFMEKLGFEPQYLVATRLLKLSMGKRLFPRNAVLQILKEKQLIRTKFSYYVAMLLKESEFLRKYVLPHKDEAPDLREVDVSYLDSCMNVADYGKVLIQLPTYYGLALLSMQKKMEDVFTTSFDFDVRLKLMVHIKFSLIKD